MFKLTLFKLFAVCCLVLSGIGSATAQNAFAIDSVGNLLRFSVTTPGTIVTAVTVTGLQGGETILDIDFRPVDGRLYALGSTGRLYVINTSSGVATLQATLTADPADTTNPFTGLTGTRFAIDFNPVADRLRVVSNTGMNVRVNPLNGTVTTDVDLNPGSPAVGGNAYTNSFAGAPSTTLYAIDTASDALVVQNPPNNGTLTAIGAGLGVGDIQLAAPFDVTVAGVGYAALTTTGTSSLYSIDLTTGVATLVGAIGNGSVLVTGLALAQTNFTATLVGTTATFTGTAGNDTIVFDASGGLLRHNRFTAGDAGFNSDFDFDPAAPGDQTLSASDPSVMILVFAGLGNDQIVIGSPSAPKSGLATHFNIAGEDGTDSVSIENSADVISRTITLNGNTLVGLGGPVAYQAIETFDISLGTGSDAVEVLALSVAGTTSINTGGGADTVSVMGEGVAAGRMLTLNGGDATDTLIYDSGGIQPSIVAGPQPGQTTINRTGSGSVVFQDFEAAPQVDVAPAFTNGPPPNGTPFLPYSFTYTATGTPAPTFAVTSGALPTGLTLSASGAITGTPTLSGTFIGVVTASNGVLPNATQAFSITIVAPAALQIPTLDQWGLVALIGLLMSLAWIRMPLGSKRARTKVDSCDG